MLLLGGSFAFAISAAESNRNFLLSRLAGERAFCEVTIGFSQCAFYVFGSFLGTVAAAYTELYGLCLINGLTGDWAFVVYSSSTFFRAGVGEGQAECKSCEDGNELFHSFIFV